MTGPAPLRQLCVKHLRADDRVIVAFEGDVRAWIILVGAHIDDEPQRNIYDLLYALAGVAPEVDEKRTKPRCCGDSGFPPKVDTVVIDDLVAQARTLMRSHHFW